MDGGQTVQWLNEVQPAPISWLWRGYVPFGKVTVVEGDPGQGKSTLTLDLAARLTRGAAMPFGADGETGPRSVLVLTAEDGVGDTIRPRVETAGGDVTRVAVLPDASTFELGEDLSTLWAMYADVRPSLVIIDPLMAFLPHKIKAYEDHSIRRVLRPLHAFSESTGCAVILVRHLNKGSGGKAIYRGGASIGIGGAARSVLVVARDRSEPSRSILASVKSNLGPPPPALAFRITTGPSGSSAIKWEGSVSISADELLAEPSAPRSEAMLAAFFQQLVSNGPVPASEGLKQMHEAGFEYAESSGALHRARKSAGVESVRQGTGWWWRLKSAAKLS